VEFNLPFFLPPQFSYLEDGVVINHIIDPN